MSGNESNYSYQNIEQSKDQRRKPVTTYLVPIACRVCDKIFFDNVSLVLHFECHLKDEIPIPTEHSIVLASLQNDRPTSLNSPQLSYSFVEKINEAHYIEVPRRNEYSRPSSLSVCSTKTSNVLLTNMNLDQIPVLNSMPPLSPRYNLAQSTLNSTIRQKTTLSLSHPLFHSQLGTSRVALGLAPVPLQLHKQNVGRRFSYYKNPQIKQLGKRRPCKEIIVISDDEEDDNRSTNEVLDLTLKL